MLIAGFDLETTGFDGTKDHVVQYSFQMFNDDKRILNQTSLVNPEVPVTASEIHGIYDVDVMDAPKELDALKSIDSLFVSCYENSIPVAIMNAKFDLTFYRNVLSSQYGILSSVEYLILDPLVIDKHFDKYRPGKRNLESLAAHYGIRMPEKFHSADFDVETTVKIAVWQISKWDLGTDWHKLTSLQSKWSDEQTLSLRDYFISSKNEAYKNMKLGWPVETTLIM